MQHAVASRQKSKPSEGYMRSVPARRTAAHGMSNHRFLQRKEFAITTPGDAFEQAARIAESVAPVHAAREEPNTASHTAEEIQEGPGLVSQTLPTAPTTLPVPTAPIVGTSTVAAAPDGTRDTRHTVAVNEIVIMTWPGAATWTASGGALAPSTGSPVIWTAPSAGATCTVTATSATGNPAAVLMTVIPPSHRSLVKQSDRTYDAGKAGSGFVAAVTIMPTNVSFTQTEVWEGTVNAVATGYYDTVLHQNNVAHPKTPEIVPDAMNSGIVDTIGTNEPGTPGPFSPGTFIWAIPQLHRPAGSTGGGSVYSEGRHAQVMIGTQGAEGTAKEGASRGRVP